MKKKRLDSNFKGDRFAFPDSKGPLPLSGANQISNAIVLEK
jgi:hypothetical protein